MAGPFLAPLCLVQDPKMPYTQQLTKSSLGSAFKGVLMIKRLKHELIGAGKAKASFINENYS